MAHFVLCTIFQLILVLTLSQEESILNRGCSQKLDILKCSMTYYCSEFVDLYINEINRVPMMSLCSPHIIRNSYIGGYYLPSHIIYKFDMLKMEHNEEKRAIPSVVENTIIHSSIHYVVAIITLDISNNLLSDCPLLKSMPNLRSLNVSRNFLTKAVLYNANELKSLTDLDFSYNNINSIEVNYSQQYRYLALNNLNLSHNQIDSIPDGTFEKYNNITTLDLSHNNINALNVITFEGIKNILYLNLSNNKLVNINSCLVRFTKLTELNLSNNMIKYLKYDSFQNITELKKLDLSFNAITNINKTVLMNFNNLRFLDLSNNRIEMLDKETFSSNPSLESINLSRNYLKVLNKGLFKGKHISLFSVKENILEGPLVKGMFEGLKFVRDLDLSSQRLISIENFAFFGLDSLNILLLNNSKIQTIYLKAFSTLQTMEYLDLSNNEITCIEFVKENLVSLRTLILNNNYIVQIKSAFFDNLQILTILDLSNNNIAALDSKSFKYLNDLITFKISNNPINGTLKEETFEGLYMLPSLDISSNSLLKISNNCFKGMTQMRVLNMSHNIIIELQFNCFANTGVIEILDLSFNRLYYFEVNTTNVINLNTLILSNNFLTVISIGTFKDLSRLQQLIISHNDIERINHDSFFDQKDLKYLDLSFNPQLQLNVSLIEKLQLLDSLLLSGTRINLKNIRTGISITYIEMAYLGISIITELELNRLQNLENIILSNNYIIKVEIGALSNITRLRTLDLSFNKISYIQPGCFRDNSLLYSLNVSHNLLTSVNYGIFRSLTNLHVVDLSYNNIDNLESERFDEVTNLSVLIVDHNKINFINAHDFNRKLLELSIGGNPLPCDILVTLKKMPLTFDITAIILDETEENIDGVTCNVNNSNTKLKSNIVSTADNDKVMIDIRNVLQNISTAKATEHYLLPANNNSQYLNNITNQIEHSNANLKTVQLQLVNLTSNIVDGNKNTNVLLDKIARLLTTMNTRKSPPISIIPKQNTSVDWLTYVNKIKEHMEDALAIEKQNILAEVEYKISLKSHQETAQTGTSSPSHEAFSSNDKLESKTFVIVVVSVGLIIILLIGFIFYKLYNFGIFVPTGRSYSTRNLPETMENSNL